MKKKLLLSTILVAVIALSFILTACGTSCVHHWGDWNVTTAATCTAGGSESRTCTKCDKKQEQPITALGHSHTEYVSDGNATCLADGTKSAACDNAGCTVKDTVADAGSKTQHTYTIYTPNGNATCLAGGTETAVCDTVGCTATDTKAGSKLAHTFTTYTPDGNATCLSGGTVTAVCDTVGCNETHSKEGTKSAHSFTTYTPNGNATCLDEGTVTAVCDTVGCTVTDTKAGSKIAHTFTNYVSNNDATCTEDGTKTAVCSTNGCSETNTIKDTGSKKEHVFTDYKLDNNATCSEEGTKTAVCNNDGCTETNTVTLSGSKVSHTFTTYVSNNDATCTADGTETAVCGTDGCSETDTRIDVGSMLAHDCDVETIGAKCAETGSRTSTCKDCDYVKVETLKVLGHDWDIAKPTCEQGQQCLRDGCDASVPANGHNYELVDTKAADCTSDGEEHYECSDCGDHYHDTTEAASGHTVDRWTLDSEILKDGETCTYVQTYKGTCSECSDTVEKTEDITKHTLKVSITTPATCQTGGIKTYTCTACDYSRAEGYSDASAHTWNGGEAAGAYTLYTCTVSGCGETKKSISAKDKTQTDVNKNDLAGASEIELKEAVISLDAGTLSGIAGENVSLSADTLKDEELADAKSGLTTEQLQKLGENKIYNFTMESDGGLITSFNGKVTVRIPYTLEDGEDPDCIVVWYIDSDGNVTSIQAEYSNGYAVFETNHFSYYTVTKMSQAERCELYGHSYAQNVKNPTCVADGYTLYLCQRCGHSEVGDIVKALGHDYEQTTKDATCTKNGEIVHTCKNCDYSYKSTIKAIGHDFVLTETKEATCIASGYLKYTCSHEGCTESYKTTLAQKSHTYTEVVTPPTCTEGGYTTYTCSGCGHSYTANLKKATGHNHVISVVEATCTEEGYTLFTCACGDHYKTDIVSPSHKWDIDYPTCGQGQTCLDCGETGLPATGDHSMKDGVCTECGHGCTHSFTESKILPTCTERGYTERSCSLCGIVQRGDYIAALGHTGEFDCDNCDFKLFGDDFFMNMFSSFYDNYVIRLNNFVMYTDTNTVIEFAELSIGYDFATGEYYGYGYFSMHAGSSMQVEGYAVIKDGNLYLRGVGNFGGGKASDYYNIMPISSLFGVNGLPSGINQIPNVVDLLIRKLAPVMQGIAMTNPDGLSEVILNFVKEFTVVEKTAGGYVITINAATLNKLNEALSNLSVAQLYELLTGNSAEDLEATLNSILDMTVEQFAEMLEENGFTLEEFAELIDGFIGITPFGSFSVTEMLEYLNSSSEYDGITVGEIFALIMGAESAEQISDQLSNILSGSVYDLIGMITGMDAGTIYNFVNQFIYNISSSDYINIVCDGDGYVMAIHADVNFGDYFECNVDIVKGYVSDIDYDAIISGVEERIAHVDYSEVIEYLKSLGYTVTVDENGVIWISYTETHEDSYDNYIRENIVERQVYGHETIYYGYIIPGYIMTNQDCINILQIGIFTYVEQTMFNYSYRYLYNVNTDEIIEIQDEWEDRHVYSGMRTVTYLYNTVTKQILDGYTGHNYVRTFGFEPEGCNDIGEIHYSCTHCGDSYIQYFTRGHDNFYERYELLGESCIDGVLITTYCGICHEELWANVHEGKHFNYREYLDLTGYDVCEHHQIEIDGCVCGEQLSVWFNGFMIETNRISDDLIEYIYSCRDCGLRAVETVTSERYGCEVTETTVITVTYTDANGQVILWNKTMENTYTSHANLRNYVELLDGSSSCEDGVNVIEKCAECGYEHEYTFYHHYYGIINTIDFTDYGAETGCLYFYGCACGEYTDSNFRIDNEKNYDMSIIFHGGMFTPVYVHKADGFAFLLFTETEKIGCEVYAKRVIYLGYDIETGAYLDRYVYNEYTYFDHDHIDETARLGEGSTNCNDGIIVTSVCRDCGEVLNQYSSTGHDYYFISEESLTDYGSVCGGTLTHTGCPCGLLSSYAVQSDCNMDHQGIDQWTYYNVCSVTDPQCGFTIKYSFEKVDDSCNRYLVMYINYNRQTEGYSLRVVDFNSYREDHNFVTTERECHEGHREVSQICPVCGVGEIHEYDEFGREIKWTTIGLNYTHVRIFAHYNGGYQYIVSSRYDSTNDYWYEYTYTYNFDGVCTQTEYYSNSDGHSQVNENNCCYLYHHGGTCTQPGKEICNVCGDVNEDSYPNGHRWQFVSEEIGYQCWVCGLYSANGAVGVIDIEELTGSEGYNPDDYVIGYYNRGGHEYLVVVSLVLYEPNEFGEDIILTNITVTDDGRSIIRISSHDIEQWAIENGYGGVGYDVRITFVPIDYYDDCDYSLTITLHEHNESAYREFTLNGATCDDGVTVSYYCSICHQRMRSESYHGHRTYVTCETPLTEYGSVCGGSLLEYSCACGQLEHYELIWDCNMDHQYVDNWNHYNVCLECGFTVKFSYEKVDDSCRRYLVMYIGYDTETHESMRRVVNYNDSLEDHNYVISEIEGQEGHTERSEICSVCGVGTISEYDEYGRHIKWTYISVGNINIHTYEYYNDMQYVTTEWHENAGGYWSKNTYTYSFDGICTRTVLRVDSEGFTESYEENLCRVIHYLGNCTQFGREICDVCGDIKSQWHVPQGHDWQAVEEGAGYYCTVCWQLSEIGAEAKIDYELIGLDGWNYFIGYCLRGDYEYMVVVSVVVYDEELGETAIAAGVSVTDDGVSKVMFNRQEVEQWAASNGYGEAGYYITLTFVFDGDSNDYSIRI